MNKHWTFEEDLFYRCLSYDLMITGSFMRMDLKRSTQRNQWMSEQAAKVGFPVRSKRSVQQRRTLYMIMSVQEIHNLSLADVKKLAPEVFDKVCHFYNEIYGGPNKDVLLKLHK